MDMVTLTIGERPVQARAGMTVLEAADAAGVYIPRLCSHPDLPTAKSLTPVEFVYRGDQRFDRDGRGAEFEGCRLCIVQVAGRPEFLRACNTLVELGMVVHTDTPEVRARRQDNFGCL